MNQHHVNTNIEFAHIYAGHDFGSEQIQSLGLLKNITNKLEKQKITVQTSILVDDTNQLLFDEQILLQKLSTCEIVPNGIFYESTFDSVANQIIQMLPQANVKKIFVKKDSKNIVVYRGEHGQIGLKQEKDGVTKYTCALLSSAWTLCRLGCFAFPKTSDTFKQYSVSDNIITILPKKYRANEEKVAELIKATEFRDQLKRVQYEFF